MLPNRIVISNAQSTIATHTVIRNTWLLLSFTLLFSSATAFLSVLHPPATGGMIVTFIAGFVLLFVTQALRNSGWGIVSIFAFTGCMGYSLGPMLSQFIRGYTNGGQLILTSLAATGAFFFLSSAWVVATKRDLSGIGKIMMIGLVVCIFASIANIFLHMPAMQLAVSSMMVVISAGLMMYDTSRIINNGETNYIMATIALYLDILMLFQNLLILLGSLSGDRK